MRSGSAICRTSNLIARRVGPFYGKLVASPDYIKAHGAPETPAEILAHQALMQGTEQWQFMDGEKVVTVYPQGRFKADNGLALVDAALAGLGIANLPEGLVAEHIASGALVPIMTRYPLKPAGMFVVRPPSQYPARKLRTLTEMLIACFNPDAIVLPSPPPAHNRRSIRMDSSRHSRVEASYRLPRLMAAFYWLLECRSSWKHLASDDVPVDSAIPICDT